jgi:hypothetical protein
VIEEAHETESFGDRHNVGGAKERTVGAPHPHQAFVEGRLPAAARHHLLIGKNSAR